MVTMKVITSQNISEKGVLPVCDNSKYLKLLSCGIYDLRNTSHTFLCNRPEGMCQSYMFHIVLSGKGHHMIAGRTHILQEGQCILYKPSEKQEIVHYGKENPVYVWMHFCGYDAEKIIKELHLNGIHSIKYFSATRIEKTILQLIYDMKSMLLEKECKEYLCLSRFLKLLCTISSGIENNTGIKTPFNRVTPAVEYMTTHYATAKCSNKDYAEMCFMSESRFVKVFKDIMGVTPQKYLESKRIEAAKELLISSNMQISQISEIVGYTDSYYFSRAFKKVCGISPREFTKSCS